jgi:cyclic pyranopterin phosphate synthase
MPEHNEKNGKSESETLKDAFGRELCYVRLSVTDRCNFRCRYCMPEEGVEWVPHEKILSYEDMLFLIEILRGLGVKKVRFTGGEPLVRRGMVSFLEKARTSFPELEIALTTNGSTLTRDAPFLASMGLSDINVSLDTLNPDKFAFMTRGGELRSVLDGIDALISALTARASTTRVSTVQVPATQVKVNAVSIRGFNDDSIADLTRFAFQRGITLRFIEFMPMNPALWSPDDFMPFSEIVSRLPFVWNASEWQEKFEKEKIEKENEEGAELSPSFLPSLSSLSGPARYYVNSVTGQRVGVISAVSQHFCASCNRLRCTAAGEIQSCLFRGDRVSVFDALRARDEENLRSLIRRAAALKPQVGMTSRLGRIDMHKIGG